MPLCTQTNKPATHSGKYDPISGPQIGLTPGKRYELIHNDVSYTCILINDHGSYFETDAQDFSQITDLHSLDDRPVAPKPVFDMDDMVSTDWDAADNALCSTAGIEAIVRDVVPEPEGPESTESLRQYRYTPDTF